MILDYSFRKSFLISSLPLRPDQQQIQQLLPPQIPPSSLIRTYSFSHLKNNQSLREQSDSSIDIQGGGRQNKKFQQLQNQIQLQIIEIAKLKEGKLSLMQQNKQLQDKYQELLVTYKQRSKEDVIQTQKRELVVKIRHLQDQNNALKQQITLKAEQLLNYDARNQQSRRLLQKLNENINKKQQKLIKDKQTLNKQLEQTKKLYEQSTDRQKQLQKQVGQLIVKKKQLQSDSQTFRAKYMSSDNKFAIFEEQIRKKDQQIMEMQRKLQQSQSFYSSQLHEVNSKITYEQSSRSEVEQYFSKLQEQKRAKQSALSDLKQTLKKKQIQLSEALDSIQKQRSQNMENFQRQRSQALENLERQKSKNKKIQIQLHNLSFELKQNEVRFQHLEEQIERMNITINQLKEDKRILNKEKDQLKAQVFEKISLIEQLRDRVDQSKQTQLKLTSAIQNYQKQQQKMYETESTHIEKISTLELKLNQIKVQLSKVQQKTSQKQYSQKQVAQQVIKYRKMYIKSQQTLQMYKQQTHNIKQKTQEKWNQLKRYFENQITILQQQVRYYESRYGTGNRSRIKNLVALGQHNKEDIATSRLTISRKTVKSYEVQDFDTGRKNIPADSNITKRRKFFNQTQFKQNYWHGLNNDSVEHEGQEVSKN